MLTIQGKIVDHFISIPVARIRSVKSLIRPMENLDRFPHHFTLTLSAPPAQSQARFGLSYSHRSILQKSRVICFIEPVGRRFLVFFGRLTLIFVIMAF